MKYLLIPFTYYILSTFSWVHTYTVAGTYNTIVKIEMADNGDVYFLRSAVSVQEKVQGLKVTGPTAIAVDGYVCISCLIIKRPKNYLYVSQAPLVSPSTPA